MKDDFFDEVLVPDFIREEFDREDWYLMIGKFKEIIDSKIDTTRINSGSKTMRYTGKVFIGDNCTIGDYVVIEGPVYIGNNVEIGPGAYIRPGTIISDECSIGHAAQLKNCLMMERSKSSNHSLLADSILGARARFASHTVSANRRFDQGEISFNYRGDKIKTKLTKLGVVVGENSRIGGGVQTAPGTMIGKNTFVSPTLAIKEYIPPNSYVKYKYDYEVLENRFKGELHSKSKFYKEEEM